MVAQIILDSLQEHVYISMDFSENLTMPIKEEPQSLHWTKQQTTIHNVVSKVDGEKCYHVHMSNNLKHDQSYVFVSLTSVLDTVEVKKDLVLVESDNCTSQYKSAESFHDLQYILDTYNVNLIRLYGVPGHGKNEVDSVGGVAKMAIC